MRIGLFTDTYLPDINGVVSSIETLRVALVDLGHDVYVVCTKPSLKKAELDGYILRLPGVEVKQIYGYALTSPMHIKALKIIRDLNLDIIHSHTEFGAGIFARKVSKKLGIPLVATYHTFYEDYTHYINVFKMEMVEPILKKATISFSKFFGNHCQQLIVPTIKTQERLLEYGVKTKMTIIPTGLDFSNFQSTEVIDSPFAEKEFTAIYVGRIAPEKSIDVIVNAVKRLRDTGEKINLIIVGDGPGKKEIEQLIEEKNAKDYIYMAGKIAHSDVVKYYNYGDCFVSASMSETQGMTFIEAMACGKPVLACDRVALNNVLLDNENGYFFDDYIDLADKLLLLKNKSSLEEEKMKMSAKQIADEYSPKSFAKKVEGVYEDAIENYQMIASITKVVANEREAKITVSDDDSYTTYTISLDDYFENLYHKGDGVEKKEIDKLDSLHRYWYCFKKGIKKLEASDKTEKEIREYLKSLKTIGQQQIDRMINCFKEIGYLSDENAAESQAYIDQNKYLGKRKTARKLAQRGVSKEIIDEVLQTVDVQEEIERGVLKANMYLKNIHDKSYKEVLRYIKEKLIYDGYDNVDEILSRVEIPFDEQKEMEACRKAADKAYRSYSRKYHGKELYQHQYSYLLSKGFNSSVIQDALNEKMEEETNED